MYTCDEERMEEKIKTFSQFGATKNGGVTRYSLSKEALAARREFVARMEGIGATIETDDMANIYATLEGTDVSLKRICMGSHVDSVLNGGNYDGVLGVLTAMEVLETIVKEQIPHRHPLTAMIWTNEEGSLYAPTMMSSGVICQAYLPPDTARLFNKEEMLQSVNLVEGKGTFGEALEASGFQGSEANRLSRANAECMFETHIEQGPILEEHDKEVGVVDCVLGMFMYDITMHGQTTHAGTFPMEKRKDALLAMANCLVSLHEEIDKLEIPGLVYTNGSISCHPNIHTCVPDEVCMSIEARYTDAEQLMRVEEVVKNVTCRTWNGCTCTVEKTLNRDTVYWDEELVNDVETAAKKLGISYMKIHSGAGHDAQFVGHMLPTTMIFVRTKDGLSHCEQEYAKTQDCTHAASVMLNAVLLKDAK